MSNNTTKPPLAIPIRLAVNDRARFRRCGEPVAVGVPFASGELRSDEPWSLVDEQGGAVAAQATILDRWRDESIRWMLVEFKADANGGGAAGYLLTNTAVATPPGLTVTSSVNELTIDTGVARFVVAQRGTAAIARADVAQQAVLTDLTVVAEDSDGRAYSLAVSNATVIRSGPLTAVVRCGGALMSANGSPWLDSSVTLQFHAGLGAVRVEVSCTNRRAAIHPRGLWDLGDPGSVFIRDLSVTMKPSSRGHGAISASIDRDAPISAAGNRFEIYQDSSGGELWNSRNHVNRNGRVPMTFRGFQGMSDGRPLVGFRATPVASLNTGNSRITIATPLFWEVFPKSVTLSRETCSVGVLPRQCSDSHELQGGERTTFGFMLGVGDDPVSEEPLAWARSPLIPTVAPQVFRRAGLWAPLSVGSSSAQHEYEKLVHGVVDGDASFARRREIIDEYGWRHFGEIYADHEAVSHPGLISHYNNQYDAIAGMATRFMMTGDARWSSAMCELATHVADIDLYHSTKDRAAYNGGYFWHTQHYVDAGTATHRSYSRLSVSAGGGPSAEHNYTTGLLLHHFLTGSWQSREAVLGLADWVLNMDDGRKSRFRWIDWGDTGLASATRSVDFHGPGRGAGNSINALLDAHRLSGDPRYLAKADSLILRCVSPDDDQDSLQLLDAENRWSYTVFLQTLGKYLDYRTELGLVDQRYTYAREVLLRYAKWMAAHERPYLEHPAGLEYPTETWAAQDIRKAAVFEFAARYAHDAKDRAQFLARATDFFDYSTTTLHEASTGRLARPLVLLLAYGFQRPISTHPLSVAPPLAQPHAKVKFVPLRRRVVQRLGLIGAALVATVLVVAALWLL